MSAAVKGVLRGAFSVLSGRIGPCWACAMAAGVLFWVRRWIGDRECLPRRARANFWCEKFAGNIQPPLSVQDTQEVNFWRVKSASLPIQIQDTQTPPSCLRMSST
jgi:hypothetical protein